MNKSNTDLKKLLQSVDFSKNKIGIVVSLFNLEISKELLENTKKELIELGIKSERIITKFVFGALEAPFKVLKLSASCDAIIALGAVIKGETSHYDLVNNTTYNALMQISLEKKKPVIFGILTCNNIKEAKERASRKGLNKAKEYVTATLLQLTDIKIDEN